MNISWKYVEELHADSINVSEHLLNICFPLDYKSYILICNAGKPSLSRFDIKDRKECVLDYMLNLNIESENSIVKTSIFLHGVGLSPNLIPIAIDPFGNYLCYKFLKQGTPPGIFFWDHELHSTTFVCDDFASFLQILY